MVAALAAPVARGAVHDLGRAAAVPHSEELLRGEQGETRLSLSLCDTAATALSVRPRRHEAGGTESETRLWGLLEGWENMLKYRSVAEK